MHCKQLLPFFLLLPLLSEATGRDVPGSFSAPEPIFASAPTEDETPGGTSTARTEEERSTAVAVLTDKAQISDSENNTIDTVIVVDRVQVTAIKQGMILRSQPVASSIIGSRTIERQQISSVKNLSQEIPNFFAPDYGSRMTSSIYVRGLGARIDQPVVGLNIDNVPVMNKDNYDADLADVERIEVLRGPQSTLYGRNTMGGVINVYTLSPLTYQGVRLMAEYSSGNSYKFRASSYYLLNPNLGMAVTGYYNHTGGFFKNLSTGEKCDWEKLGGGRWKMQWRSRSGLRIDNTFSFTVLKQGGYPYAYVGDEIIHNGETVIRPGEISYNDPCSYKRTTISDGVTVRYDAEKFSVASITSYQYSDDEMLLDQDFLPLSYFTLKQAHTEHSVTEDLIFRSRDNRNYRWLFGAFGFYRHGVMDAPVNFKKTGIDELILKNANANDVSYHYDWGKADGTNGDELFLGSDFRMPSVGGALYHESNYTLGRWRFTAGLRFDIEHAQLRYHNFTDTWYTKTNIDDGTLYERHKQIDDHGTLKQNFTELLPKFSVTYSFDPVRNLYISVSKGYKAGGFNTQIFSDVLQQKMMNEMGIGEVYDVTKGISYKPEYSWNYEFGGHFSCLGGAVRGDFALFYIDCRDQQLTVFPPGQTTGRMMTNAGHTHSYGAEASLQMSPWESLDINVAYGYTNAKFLRYETTVKDNDGNPESINYKGNYLPYAPENTFSARATWTIPSGVAWLGDVVIQGGVRCAGRIWWNEENSLSQPFYALADASVGIEHPRYSLRVWGRNLTDTNYDVFYFKSIGNQFVQRGRPRIFGITLNINF